MKSNGDGNSRTYRCIREYVCERAGTEENGSVSVVVIVDSLSTRRIVSRCRLSISCSTARLIRVIKFFDRIWNRSTLNSNITTIRRECRHTFRVDSTKSRTPNTNRLQSRGRNAQLHLDLLRIQIRVNRDLTVDLSSEMSVGDAPRASYSRFSVL